MAFLFNRLYLLSSGISIRRSITSCQSPQSTVLYERTSRHWRFRNRAPLRQLFVVAICSNNAQRLKIAISYSTALRLPAQHCCAAGSFSTFPLLQFFSMKTCHSLLLLKISSLFLVENHFSFLFSLLPYLKQNRETKGKASKKPL